MNGNAMSKHGCALAVAVLIAGCGDGGGGSDGGGTDLGAAQDMPTSLCGAMGPFGTYTSVNGGQSGVTACGRTFTSFSGATLTLADTGGGTASLTVTGTGTVGDTTNCPATVNECEVSAKACPTGSSSTISYTLMTYTRQLTGTASPSIPGPGGGCQFTYSIAGTR